MWHSVADFWVGDLLINDLGNGSRWYYLLLEEEAEQIKRIKCVISAPEKTQQPLLFVEERQVWQLHHTCPRVSQCE